MKTEKEQSKKPYEKPRLKIIELTTEEIMGFCKTSLGSGPTGACRFCSTSFGNS